MGIITPDLSRPGSNGNEGVLNIFQSSRADASPWDGLELYPEPLLLLGGGLTPSAEMQSAYSTAPANWAQFCF